MRNPKRNEPFGELLGEFAERLRGDHWQPAVDVFETEKALVVRIEMAGLRSGDVRVTVDGDLLRVRGARTPPTETDGVEVMRLHQMEIAFGPFERVVRIGIPFDAARVTATLEEGFLRVTLPKRIPSKQRIEVESSK